MGTKSLLGVMIAGLVALAAALPARTAVAQGRDAIVCGGFYTVVRGDTLHDIAVRAYGRPEYRFIYDANREVLPSITFIEVGDRILVPCLDGSGFQSYREAVAGLASPGGATVASTTAGTGVSAAAATEAGTTAGGGPLARIAVLNETRPYAGRRLPEGGMITELVSRAMARSRTPVGYEVVFPDSEPLAPGDLAAAGFDLGFPAARPDCRRQGSLPAAEAALCSGFLFSDPIAESELRFYVAEGSALAGARRSAELDGRRICLTRSALVLDTQDRQLIGPAGNISREAGALDCFARVVDGTAEVAIVSGIGADWALSRRGFKGGVAELVTLRQVRDIHVITQRGNPRGRAFLATLNAGVAEIVRSGEWQAVVDNHRASQAQLF